MISKEEIKINELSLFSDRAQGFYPFGSVLKSSDARIRKNYCIPGNVLPFRKGKDRPIKAFREHLNLEISVILEKE